MKRLMIIVCIVWQPVICSGQRSPKIMAGIDAAQALRGIAGLQFSYGFSGHWSAGAGVSIDFTQLGRPASDEERAHYGEFGEEKERESGSVCCSGTISLKYWPAGTFRNSFIGIGAVFESTGTADIMMSAGYTFRIWKNILLTASYGICLRDGPLKNHPSASGISLCVSYNF